MRIAHELRRDATVASGDVGRRKDVDELTRTVGDPEPLVLGHAAWALERLRRHG